MASISNKSKPSEEFRTLIDIQRHFRHRRHSKKSELSPEYHTPLFVRTIKSANGKKELYNTLISWREFSDAAPLEQNNPKQDAEEARDLYASLVVSSIYNESSNPSSWIGAFDKNETLQAVAHYEIQTNSSGSPYVYLDLLATAPWNLTKEAQVRGGGTALIEKIIHVATPITGPSPILVETDSTKWGEDFYKKLGFEHISTDPDDPYQFKIENRAAFLNRFAGRALVGENR
jgi:hypothetical protein